MIITVVAGTNPNERLFSGNWKCGGEMLQCHGNTTEKIIDHLSQIGLP